MNREDIWREAAKALGVAAADIPASTSRGKETFFDGKVFDPENPQRLPRQPRHQARRLTRACLSTPIRADPRHPEGRMGLAVLKTDAAGASAHGRASAQAGRGGAAIVPLGVAARPRGAVQACGIWLATNVLPPA